METVVHGLHEAFHALWCEYQRVCAERDDLLAFSQRLQQQLTAQAPSPAKETDA